MTDYHIGSTYHGFTLQRMEKIKEIDSTVFLFTHEVLRAPVLAIKNNDDNKTFSIAFQTVPEDSTGVAHILEHSVLMGSKKYPVKDVFGEINKGGLMTFLNAMTGQDVTYYPFATRNLKEYFNIMDVYCDVVLNPLIPPATFEQEGWHYHKEAEEQPLEFQGVVFNEMKGAFADPIRAIFQHTFAALMPDSTYVHESGGDPKNIPDLTYEQFIEFHRSHYHPSNAAIFFYGNAPLDEELAFVQDRFLQAYGEAREKAAILPGSDITEPIFIEDVYGAQPDSDLSGKTFHAVSSVIGEASDRKRNAAMRIIANILYNSDASPLKDAILSQGLCKDFGGLFLHNASIKTVLMTYLVGSEPHQRDAFLQLYRQTLGEMVEQGLDRDLVLSELNKFEFSTREEMIKAQRGLDLIGKAMPALKYDGDPFDSLRVDELLADIREAALEHGYFEELIKKYLLDNPATAVVTLKPDPQKTIATLTEERKRLQAHEASLSAEEIKQLISRTHELLEMQHRPNDEETLTLLPHLSRGDLNRNPDFHAIQEERLNDRPLLLSELPTNAISYMEFGFDCSGVDADLLRYLDLFGVIICEIGTAKQDYMRFAQQLNLLTGGFSHSFSTHIRIDDRESLKPLLWFQVKALSAYLEPAMELVAEVFAEVNFEDRRHIREIVQREFAWAEHSAQSDGYGLATSRVFAHLSKAGQYNDYISGITAYQSLKELALRYDELEEEFIANLKRLQALLFRRDGLILADTAVGEDINRFRKHAPMIIDALGDEPLVSVQPDFQQIPRHEGFCTSSEVVYNVQGCKLFKNNGEYNGQFEVLKTWLSRDYLWNTVRQIGGAYGCFVQFNHISGNFALVSYRDPQIRKTFNAYNAIAERVAELNLSDQVMNQLIIGAYGKFDPHQGPASRAATARNDYLSGITPEYKQRRVEDILRASNESLRGFAPLFKALAEEGHRITIGSGEKIRGEKELYEVISDI